MRAALVAEFLEFQFFFILPLYIAEGVVIKRLALGALEAN